MYVPNAAGQVEIETLFGYDARWLLTQVTDPDGGVSNTTYDQMGRVTHQLSPTVTSETARSTTWSATSPAQQTGAGGRRRSSSTNSTGTTGLPHPAPRRDRP
ncbi:MAG: RHS repeat protein [Microthrixaceae bacterium]|nr:RHS repeat protein [Microthrixaceae bacterium]